MLVKVLGKLNEVRPQQEKAPFSIAVIPSGTVKDNREPQLAKARTPIEVT